MDEMYRRCHIALPGLDDERALHGTEDAAAAARRIAALGVAEICVKQGAKGCLLYRDGNARTVPAQGRAQPVDTTAAGDSFNAAYLHRRLQGGEMTAAAEAGHRLAARVIQFRGAVIPIDAMPNTSDQET